MRPTFPFPWSPTSGFPGESLTEARSAQRRGPPDFLVVGEPVDVVRPCLRRSRADPHAGLEALPRHGARHGPLCWAQAYAPEKLMSLIPQLLYGWLLLCLGYAAVLTVFLYRMTQSPKLPARGEEA